MNIPKDHVFIRWESEDWDPISDCPAQLIALVPRKELSEFVDKHCLICKTAKEIKNKEEE